MEAKVEEGDRKSRKKGVGFQAFLSVGLHMAPKPLLQKTSLLESREVIRVSRSA